MIGSVSYDKCVAYYMRIEKIVDGKSMQGEMRWLKQKTVRI